MCFPEELWWFHWFPSGAFQHIWLVRPWALLQLGSVFYQSQPNYLNSLCTSWTFLLKWASYSFEQYSCTVWRGHSLLGERKEKLDSFHSKPEWMRNSVPSLSCASWGHFCHPWLSDCCYFSAEIVTPQIHQQKKSIPYQLQASWARLAWVVMSAHSSGEPACPSLAWIREHEEQW